VTYEPGQQVLVRGEVDATAKDDGEYLICFRDATSRFGVLVLAADVVGPAPATPDEGEYHEVTIAKLWLELREARSALGIDVIVRKDREIADLTINAARLRDALAAAEARIAAALKFHRKTKDDEGVYACYNCGLDWPCPTVDALSVEAAGTEGGGSDA
jgi:hypothetical protein